MFSPYELQEHLKDYSQQQLAQEMKSPSGKVPQYLLLTEMQRRKRVQEDFKRANAQSPETTVWEDMTGGAPGVPQQGIQGIAGAMAPQTNMNQNTAAMGAGPQAPAPVRGMQMGGPVGGSSDTIAQLAAAYGMSVEEFLKYMGPRSISENKDPTEAGTGLGGRMQMGLRNPGDMPPRLRHESILAAPRAAEENFVDEGFQPPDLNPLEIQLPAVRNALGTNSPDTSAGLATGLKQAAGQGDTSGWSEWWNTPVASIDLRTLFPDDEHEFLKPGGLAGDAWEIAKRSGRGLVGAGGIVADLGKGLVTATNTVVNPYVEYATGYKFPTPDMSWDKSPTFDDMIGWFGDEDPLGDIAENPMDTSLRPQARPVTPDVNKPGDPEAAAVRAATDRIGGAGVGGVGSVGSAGSLSASRTSKTSGDDWYEQDKYLALARFGAALMSMRPGEAASVGLDALQKARADYMERKQTAELMALKRAAASGRGSGRAPKPISGSELEKLARLWQERVDRAETPADKLEATQELNAVLSLLKERRASQTRLGGASLGEEELSQLDFRTGA